jgi:hypothetical protein
MPVDIASGVTAEYTAVIPVPLDGEYANSDALQAMVKPIADRVEYMKQRFDDAPWARSEFFDDFVSGGTAGSSTFLADTLWQLFGTNAATFSNSGNSTLLDGTTFGILEVNHAAGTVSSNLLSKGVISGVGNTLGEMASFRRSTVRVRTGNIASGMNFEIGLDNDSAHAVGGSSAAITAVFQPSVSANWRLRAHDGASAVFTDTGVPVVADTWYQLDLVSDGLSVVSLSINGAAAVVADAGDLPAMTTDCAFVMRFGFPAAGASRTWLVDFVHGRFELTGRVL